jgi:MoxR-like ATPase
MMSPHDASVSFRNALQAAGRGLVERESLIEMVALAAIAGEHVLLIGAPGTAKSEVARRAARAIGGSYFEYLLGRFTEPSEIFGPVDLRKLREGTVEVETRGMLPEAEIAFLDEVFLGSTAILNTLLGLLNERTFRRGHTAMKCPLRVCVGASNALPDEDSLAAFADRFLVRSFLEPVADSRLEDLLEGGWALAQAPEISSSLEALDVLSQAARDADLAPVRPHLAHALRLLRKHGVGMSDRRAVRVQRLIAAAAVMAGRTTPTEADLWPIVTAVSTRDEQITARNCLRELLARSDNPSLSAAAEEATAGPLVRARRLAARANVLLDAPRPEPIVGERGLPDAPDRVEAWWLQLEGILREMDAGFAPGTLPSELSAVRERIKVALTQRQGATA